jgi:ankyrin repeat protein
LSSSLEKITVRGTKEHQSAKSDSSLSVGFAEFIDRGANSNAQGEIRWGSLHAACSEGQGKIAQMLLDRGIDANAQGGRYGNAI